VRAAADELGRLLRRTDDPAHRALALFALRRNEERRGDARAEGGRRPATGRGPCTGPLPVQRAAVRAGEDG
jgi:hypothetical protein